MSKTTALTFTVAFLLLSVCVMTSLYGPRIIESQLPAPDEVWTYGIYDGYQTSLRTMERMVLLTGLLSSAVAFAGALLWDRETRPPENRASILGLDGTTTRRTVRTTAPRQTMVAARARVDETSAPAHEEESLTPLERVIRGY